MARIDPSALKQWTNGETVTAEDYKQEREILRIANNNNHDMQVFHEEAEELPHVNKSVKERHLDDNSVGSRIIAPSAVGATHIDPDLLRQKNDIAVQAEFDLRGINIKKFGAKVDGVTDDTDAIREAITYCEVLGLELLIPGVSVITGEIEVKHPITINGIGSGSGYADKALTEYRQTSGFLVKGTGQKRVRTRVNYRSNASDPQDIPLSAALNIQAENVTLRNFTIFLDFDKTDISPVNYGSNWDIGIFLGCRVHNSINNVHVLGYWREASIYFDVTRSSYTPEFNDLNGNPYFEGTVRNGADGLTLEKIFTLGGKWGLKIQGAKPKAGQSGYSDLYYDELTGTTVTDRRGNFGASDVTAVACSFYGTNHHTKYRRDDSTGNYLTDNGGGSVSIDGLAGNASGALQGMRFISCRFSTWEPFRIKLDRVNRPVFIGCHSEGGSGALKTNGSPVLFDDTDYYGPISTTSNTKNLVLVAFNATLRPVFIGSSDYTNTANAGSDVNSFAKGFSSGGDSSINGGLFVNGSLIKTSGEMDIRGAAGNGVRFRNGSSSVALINSDYATFYPSISVRPSSDNSVSVGQASNRFSTVFAGTGTINTSDRNSKQQILKIDNKVLDAWSEVNYFQFKFNDAVEEKGDEARTHFGIIAQEIEEAFTRHGLNAFNYGLLCYDEWEDQYEEIDGNKVLVTPKGSRYSIRPDECLMLESALIRRELAKIMTLIS
ncbi:tail fiber domain-containing protein [Bacillus sp. J37]|uniref:tail fiber domain-containing protein n=1 Tax=Bacillus sp. J37 TaxID=935837 RepID=UPI00047CC96C|nr:tail fiber domain-containing protein [Bacillus sp. J37]